MGKYTSNDNRSMQCNPNNERYYSSRGFNNDDDDDYYNSNYEFDLAAFNDRRDRENINLKDRFDDLCLSLGEKKTFFRQQRDRFSPVYPNIEKFFTDVLKVDDSVECYKGLTLNFESFKSFFNSSSVKNENIKRIIDIGNKFDLLYIYFQDVYVSKRYMIFNLELYKSQGGWRSVLGEHQKWYFSSLSYNSLRKNKPDVVYEDFKDFLVCK
jgi:hypothetical protein